MSFTSLIVVCYNNRELTKQCIRSIEDWTTNYELILIDNCSKDGTAEVLKEYRDRHTVVLNQENKGYAYALNQGIELARGDKFVILNNDIVVSPHWLDDMISHLNDNNIVAPLSRFCYSGQEVMGVEPRLNYDEIRRIGNHIRQDNFGKSKQINFASGFCLLMTKKLVSKIGLFDENMVLGGDDFDLTIRLRENNGYYTLCMSSFVFHLGHQAFKSDTGSKGMNEKSWEYFGKKYTGFFDDKDWNNYFFGDDVSPAYILKFFNDQD